MKNENGVTLISLVITIIVLLILASISTFSGVRNVNESRDSAAKTELKFVQQAVLQTYTKYTLTDDNDILVGLQFSDFTGLNEIIEQIEEKTNITIELKDNNANNYYLLDGASLHALGITNTEDEYIVNYTTGEVINKTKLVTSKSKEPLYIYGKNNK